MQDQPEPRIRAAVYVLRGHGEDTQLLVFDHVDFPEVGTQVPGGGVDPGESLDHAARREVLEEAGLSLTGELTALGINTSGLIDAGREQISVFFSAETSEPRNSWNHRVTGAVGDPGSDAGLLFRCYFVPLSVARAAGENYHFRHVHLLRQ